VDAGLIPTGELRDVTGTPFDFRRARQIGAWIDAVDEQLRHGQGYDHNFVLDAPTGSEPRLAARLHDPVSGRTMELLTTEPGLQFYSGNVLRLPVGASAAAGPRLAHRPARALEPQHFPDSPNQPAFPSTILRPGEAYQSRTVYRFTVA
jgi:aldose 1-epimerase